MPRRSVEGYLIGAAFIALLAKVHYGLSDKNRTQTEQQKTWKADDKSFPIKPESANPGWNPEERAHHCIERVFWGWTIALYTLTFAATAAAAWFAYNAYCQTKRQADIAQSEQRPWIKINVALRDGTDFTGGFGFVDLAYVVENIGHSPAIDVKINAWAYSGRSFDDALFGFVRTQCRAFSQQISVNQEQKWIIFPGDKVPWDGALGGSVPVYRPEDITKLAIIESGRKAIPITFVGCADYIDGSDERHHQTSFVFNVHQLVMSQGVKAQTPFIDTTVPLPADQLLLQRLPSPADMTN